jgi:hypothetical protein
MRRKKADASVSHTEGTPGSCGKQGILLSALRMKIVGLDCATVDAKVGIALGNLGNGGLEIQDATLCTRERAAANVIAGWVRDSQGRVWIAIDAPLGWPKQLAETLINHRAGMSIETPANAMFRRATDVFIQQKLKKTPLDVSADRIARTAYAALAILGTLRTGLGCHFRWLGAGRCFTCVGDRGISGDDFGCPSDPVDRLQKASAD